MKKIIFTWFIFYFFLLFSSKAFSQNNYPLISKIAFGSCADENLDQPILSLILEPEPELDLEPEPEPEPELQPDLFIYLGDNIYADTKDIKELEEAYKKLGAKEEFQKLKMNIPIIATWDDHDYGWNDIGRHYELKDESKKLFLNFFEVPKTSQRYNRKGIYDSYYFSDSKHTLQIILLDERTFRDDLRIYNDELKDDESFFYKLDYFPHQNSDSTMLGEEQWLWLEKELSAPADIRIIGSGTQFGISFNGYEAWANFPFEQKKMLDLIKKTKANGVIFISGDVHYAEISKIESEELYPIYDITSSGITESWKFATPNLNRIEGPVMDNNFGLITIDWNSDAPNIKMEIWDYRNNQRIEHTISLSEITFNK